jgi:primosomal protein N' (replication factor Y)
VSKHAPAELIPAGEIEEPGFELNDDQRAALERVSDVLDAAAFRALLLFGVSGSGKTEIYIRAMRRALAAGKQAIMLVPEIALTTQLVQRLAVRFERVAVVHSGLSEVARSLTWEAIRTGAAPVVIGTRSAVFAPCADLGLIVVDEEQEPSYKNLQSPRFHVRDVAVKRAHMLEIPILLGSATPSLETWHNVGVLDTYERINLPRRVRSLPLPAVRMVDMRIEGTFTGPAALSRSLLRELEQTLARGRQAVILLNRRGFATFLYCTACGRRVECPKCKANMVLHLSRRRMLCHHCHTATVVPVHCADIACGGRLERGGGGTERIEQQLREAFPNARLHRADSDTMTHASKYQALVDTFAAAEIDVLVGTQMIAKGLDFPNVDLVGVIGADLAAAGADFRTSERLFQLVTQVAGRAGRAEAAGGVIVQTFAPETPALRYAVNHDFAAFAASELRQRRTFNMPPFTRLARYVLTGKADSTTGKAAESVATRLRQIVAAVAPERASVLGPHPCVIERIRDQYRHEVLLRAADAMIMREILDRAREGQALKVRGASVMLDVDPVALT